ncbi:hypothetical protein SAMN05518672_1157 [Chitinophaga sp. CF118]|nr:hypothetical protein SAMN05518672_1157 [Chitinophaga sp. CF118]
MIYWMKLHLAINVNENRLNARKRNGYTGENHSKAKGSN